MRRVTALPVAVALSALVPASAAYAADDPTFNDVAPILYRNCVTCHRPDNIAPFPLVTYEDAARRARALAAATAERRMPPWKPEIDYGHFEGVRRLTQVEIDTIQAWAGNGAPEGDRDSVPDPPEFPDTWQLGTPDLVVEMPEPFEIPARGEDIYRCFVLPLDLPDDQVVSAVEFRPGNRRVVHHSLFFADERGVGRWVDGGDDESGYTCFGGPGFFSTAIGGWVPGMIASRLPDGVGRPLAKRADLVIQNHYHPSGEAASDRSSVALYFSKVAATKSVFGIPVGKPDFVIPAGADRHLVASSYVTPIDLEVIGITPHMHLLGSEVRVWATLPNGEVTPLIWIKDWEFNWQGEYRYAETVKLPAGTRIDVETYYDNSASNPDNPHNPPRTVRWGEGTTDEMNVVFIQCQTDKPGEPLTALTEVVFQQPAWIGLLRAR
jgi:hypothetical protein